jgi:hypothetical protein
VRVIFLSSVHCQRIPKSMHDVQKQDRSLDFPPTQDFEIGVWLPAALADAASPQAAAEAPLPPATRPANWVLAAWLGHELKYAPQSFARPSTHHCVGFSYAQSADAAAEGGTSARVTHVVYGALQRGTGRTELTFVSMTAGEPRLAVQGVCLADGAFRGVWVANGAPVHMMRAPADARAPGVAWVRAGFGAAFPCPSLRDFALPTNPIQWVLIELEGGGTLLGGGAFFLPPCNMQCFVHPMQSCILKLSFSRTATGLWDDSGDDGAVGGMLCYALHGVHDSGDGGVRLTKRYEPSPATDAYTVEHAGRWRRTPRGGMCLEGEWTNANAGSFGYFVCHAQEVPRASSSSSSAAGNGSAVVFCDEGHKWSAPGSMTWRTTVPAIAFARSDDGHGDENASAACVAPCTRTRCDDCHLAFIERTVMVSESDGAGNPLQLLRDALADTHCERVHFPPTVAVATATDAAAAESLSSSSSASSSSSSSSLASLSSTPTRATVAAFVRTALRRFADWPLLTVVVDRTVSASDGDQDEAPAATASALAHVTYAQIAESAAAIDSAALRDVAPGAHVCVLGETNNTKWYAAAALSVLQRGCTLVAPPTTVLPTMTTTTALSPADAAAPAELRACVACLWVVSDDDDNDINGDGQGREDGAPLPPDEARVAAVRAWLGSATRLHVVSARTMNAIRAHESDALGGVGSVSSASASASASGARAVSAVNAEHEEAAGASMILFTSGTSQGSKGVVFSPALVMPQEVRFRI